MKLKAEAAAYLSLILVGACSLYLGSWPAALVLGLSVIGLTCFWVSHTRASARAAIEFRRQDMILQQVTSQSANPDTPAPPGGSLGATRGGSGSDTGAAHFDEAAA